MRLAENPPRTIMELYKMLPEKTLAEIIDGSIHMLPLPTTKHQRILGKLYRILTDYIERQNLGEVFVSPCDVFLDETSNAVQPDLIVILGKNASAIKEDAIHGVPDILLEVLSPGNAHHDLVRKKELFEKFGVREYWVIDPDTKDTSGFLLRHGQYRETRFVGRIESELLQREFTF